MDTNWIFVFIPENFGARIHLHYDISAYRRSHILYFSSTRPDCMKQPYKEDKMINKSGYTAAARSNSSFMYHCSTRII